MPLPILRLLTSLVIEVASILRRGLCYDRARYLVLRTFLFSFSFIFPFVTQIDTADTRTIRVNIYSTTHVRLMSASRLTHGSAQTISIPINTCLLFCNSLARSC
jgi:hypothetical protein